MIFKDKIYLTKASEIVNNEKLIQYYKSLLTEEELKEYNKLLDI